MSPSRRYLWQLLLVLIFIIFNVYAVVVNLNNSYPWVIVHVLAYVVAIGFAINSIIIKFITRKTWIKYMITSVIYFLVALLWLLMYFNYSSQEFSGYFIVTLQLLTLTYFVKQIGDNKALLSSISTSTDSTDLQV